MKRRITWIATGCVLAILALILLAPRSHYMPGPLLAAHVQLTGECATCHTPWRGPSRKGCIDCHGDNFSENNPHGGFDVTERSQGLLPGRKLATTSEHNLQCLSCHSEHQGAVVDINATATFACTWCHQHPSIDKVPDHVVAAMRRKFFVRHRFSQPFDHHQHKLLIDAATPPRPGGFKCESCHQVTAVAPGTSDRMSFKWSGCAGSGCHLTPQDKYLRMPASVGASPQAVAYLSVMKVRHINAVFDHSLGHLRYACADCHFRMAASKNPDDAGSLAIKQCFTCHAHQPAPLRANAQAVTSTPHGAIDDVAFASTAAPSATRVVACGDCHLFHIYGVVPQKDFAAPAPKVPPNAPPHAQLTVYLPEFRAGAGVAGLTVHPVRLSPWWIGWLAFAAVALGAVAYFRYVPAQPANQETVAGVAPQRTREVPSLDDIFQSSVRHLYIVGEAAGTASINLAMRSGRQVIEAIAGELKHTMPPIAPDLYDVVIVGCGPAGLGATATAKAAGLNYATLEKMTPASTLRSYPRAKFVQATPIDIAEYGSFFLEGDNSREKLINEWEKIISQMDLVINDREEVVDVGRQADCFLVKTARGHVFKSRCVVLAIGVRGNPRRIGLPGEVPGRVFYNLIEPGEFSHRNILVIGGGNAGAEVAQSLAAPELHNHVSYSFRSAVLTNVTRENAEKISALQQAKLLDIYPSSAIKEIRPDKVVLEAVKSATPARPGEAGSATFPVEVDNDAIFAMIGAELPTGFLKAIGVRMVRRGV